MHVYDRQLQRFSSHTLAPKQPWKHLDGKLENLQSLKVTKKHLNLSPKMYK